MGALYITAKDLYLLLRDPRALVILVVLPMIFITIFGMSAGHIMGLENESQLLQIALVNEVDYDDVIVEDLPEESPIDWPDDTGEPVAGNGLDQETDALVEETGHE